MPRARAPAGLHVETQERGKKKSRRGKKRAPAYLGEMRDRRPQREEGLSRSPTTFPTQIDAVNGKGCFRAREEMAMKTRVYAGQGLKRARSRATHPMVRLVHTHTKKKKKNRKKRLRCLSSSVPPPQARFPHTRPLFLTSSPLPLRLELSGPKDARRDELKVRGNATPPHRAVALRDSRGEAASPAIVRPEHRADSHKNRI